MANQYRVVIVGAGVAGLYAAWRLCVDAQKTTGLDRREILVIEGSARTGGRLFTRPLSRFVPGFTAQDPQDTVPRAEIGGMRFLNFHIVLGSLIQKLGLPYVKFPADQDNNWHYLRSTVMQSFSNQPSVTTFGTERVYRLTAGEQATMQGAANPGALIAAALTTSSSLVPAAEIPTTTNGVTLRSMVENVLKKDMPGSSATPLWQRGLWNLLVGTGEESSALAQVSNEAYEFWADAGAYDSVPANWNAAAAVSMVLADFSGSSDYYALTHGYETLCDALVDQLEGVPFQKGTPVTGLGTEVTGGPGYLVHYGSQGSSGFVTADNVILAMPPRAVQLLRHGLGSPLENIQDTIQQASPVPLFKIFLVYREANQQRPWWSTHLPGGTNDLQPFTRLTTDLPLRQSYNFGTIVGSDGDLYSLVQVSYSDGLRAGYWAGLLSAENGQAIDTNVFADLSPATGTENPGSGCATWVYGTPMSEHPLFSAAHAQFASMLTQIANAESVSCRRTGVEPVAGMAMDWATDPFGGGYNVWNVGVDVETAYRQVLNPVPMAGAAPGTTGTGGLFIVGEGYSLMQGWVEGALWSVEDAMAAAWGQAWTQPSGPPIPAPGS